MFEQAIGDDIGLLASARIADGSIEPYDFTDIDRMAQVGASIGGKRWRRPGDKVGVTVVVNRISREQRYLVPAASAC